MSEYIDAGALTSHIRHIFFELINKAEPIMTDYGGAFDLKIVNPLLEANKAIASIIREQPSADVVEVVHGEWIKIDKRGKNVQCSKCGNTLDLRGVNTGRGDANYCPNCGAKMRSNDVIPFNARWEIDERELGGYES